uniref:Uncharacterized protein n=1 Tax=Arundo donax TaxID=35708 RepID=A0A0A9H1G9_ARUDO
MLKHSSYMIGRIISFVLRSPIIIASSTRLGGRCILCSLAEIHVITL